MKINRSIYPLLILALFILFLSNCKKDANLTANESNIEGTYHGTVTVVGLASAPASSTLTKSSETIVDLTIIIGSDSIPLDGINISKSGSIYNLSYTGGYFEGKVEGNKLTWTLTALGIVETFSGTK